VKLVQFFVPGKGKRVGVVQGDRVLDITSGDEDVRSTLDLLIQGKTAQGVTTRATWLARRLHRRGLDWRELQRSPSRHAPHLFTPIDAPEVWGVKHTYASEPERARAQRESSEAHLPPTETPGMDGRRPALFFKATAHRVAGPCARVAIRSDSALTLPEPGLAVVLGAGGVVLAVTVCTDVTARDIEHAGAGYLSQAKVYRGACALGPCLVTPDELPDLYALQMRCSILRGGATVFTDAANTARLCYRVEDLAGWLSRDNPVPTGTTLSTGTGIRVPVEAALQDGDQVTVEVQGVGRLSNPVHQG